MSEFKRLKSEQGSVWVRADFHLHTNADKEFTYSGDPDYYFSTYVDALAKSEIQLGIITNHNKFAFEEFKALRKTARKQEVELLPGVELSVNDGANGIHILIAFSDEWISGGIDMINPFISGCFEGKSAAQYENENECCNLSLIAVLEKLERYNKDFVIILAHVEDSKGFLEEIDGGRIKKFGEHALFRECVHGFQKVRTRNLRSNAKDWLNGWYPAEVEGSDCKSIEEIGKGTEQCFVKVGELSFDALKYAITDPEHRVAPQPTDYSHSYLKSITFEDGLIKNQTIHFSPEMNNLIGIRGSGKSSIIESIRYALGVDVSKVADNVYKNNLVPHTLGSGGRVVIKAVDRNKREYEIRRILGERPDVYEKDSLIPGVSIRETILHKPLIFGQKEVSESGEDFEKDLVEKIIGDRLIDVRKRIELKKAEVEDLIDSLAKLSDVDEKIAENKAIISDTEFQLKLFSELGVESKLQKQVGFDEDARKLEQMNTLVKSVLTDFSGLINQYEDDLKNSTMYTSKFNGVLFKEYFEVYNGLLTFFETQKEAIQNGNEILGKLRTFNEKLSETREQLKDEFAEVARKLSEEFEKTGVKSVKPEDYLKLQKTLKQAKSMVEALSKQKEKESTLAEQLNIKLSELNDLWNDEFKTSKNELEKINSNHTSLTIDISYKSDKFNYIRYAKAVFKGSNLRETLLQQLCEKYQDFIQMYKMMDSVVAEAGGSGPKFKECFYGKLKALLTYKVRDSYAIKYHGKELIHHSLGQRASALILFILSQKDNDIVIIDQPEDDLDNQTIYEDVIKLLRLLKKGMQFIFATHNANFPVLGDAEQVHACRMSDDKITVESGSVDCRDIQKEIVEIMEGGREAFNRRKEIYEIWKPLS